MENGRHEDGSHDGEDAARAAHGAASGAHHCVPQTASTPDDPARLSLPSG